MDLPLSRFDQTPGGRAYWIFSEFIAVIDRIRARRRQAQFCRTFIGITGSVGKTTATNLTARLLTPGHVVASGLYLNAARHPLRQVRKLRVPTDFVVQELSGHKPGALDNPLKGLRIDVAVVTAIGLDHLTAFRTVEAVAAEKGRLVAAVVPGGVACLNADDPNCRAMAALTPERVVLFGQSDDAEVRAENVTANWPERMSFDLVIGAERRRVATRLVGTLMLPSVLAALAVVHAVGADLDAAIAVLAGIEPLATRLGVAPGAGRHTYLLDTYKASLWSTRALVADIRNWGPGRRILVLGDLSDTGNDSSRKYRMIVREARSACDLVIGVGQSASAASRVAELEGVGSLAAASLAEVRQLLDAEPPSLVILKGNVGFPLASLADESAKDDTQTSEPRNVQVR